MQQRSCNPLVGHQMLGSAIDDFDNQPIRQIIPGLLILRKID